MNRDGGKGRERSEKGRGLRGDGGVLKSFLC